MLKVRFFLNEPNGESCKHFKKMMPKLDEKYDIEIEVTSKPKPEYLTDEYFALDLPVAPAVEEQQKVMDRMEEMNLPMPEDMLLMLHMEGTNLLACPLNKDVFEFADDDFVEGVVLAYPETYYTDIVMKADMNLVF